METGTQTVLITGATSGIGYEISKLFAREKYRIIIVGHEAATLHNVSEVLKTLGAEKVYAICKSLTQEKAAEEIYHEIIAAGLKLDVLVNNASAAQAGKFMEVPASRDLEFLRQNVSLPVVLSKFFLKEMSVAGSGTVITILPHSLYELGFQPAMASAAKSFMLSLTDSLIKELQGSPVEVMAVVSGLKNISIYNKGGLLNVTATVDETEDPAVIAKAAFNALAKGRAPLPSEAQASGSSRVALSGSPA